MLGLCSNDWLSFQFHLYYGKGEDKTKDLSKIRVVKNDQSYPIKASKNISIFFDNFFTNIKKLIYLTEKNLKAIGTIIENHYKRPLMELKFM